MFESTIGTTLTGGIIPGGERINSACWVDGNDDEIFVEFWWFPGSILRTTYNRRTTASSRQWLNVHTDREAIERLNALRAGQIYTYEI